MPTSFSLIPTKGWQAHTCTAVPQVPWVECCLPGCSGRASTAQRQPVTQQSPCQNRRDELCCGSHSISCSQHHKLHHHIMGGFTELGKIIMKSYYKLLPASCNYMYLLPKRQIFPISVSLTPGRGRSSHHLLLWIERYSLRKKTSFLFLVFFHFSNMKTLL